MSGTVRLIHRSAVRRTLLALLLLAGLLLPYNTACADCIAQWSIASARALSHVTHAMTMTASHTSQAMTMTAPRTIGSATPAGQGAWWGAGAVTPPGAKSRGAASPTGTGLIAGGCAMFLLAVGAAALAGMAVRRFRSVMPRGRRHAPAAASRAGRATVGRPPDLARLCVLRT